MKKNIKIILIILLILICICVCGIYYINKKEDIPQEVEKANNVHNEIQVENNVDKESVVTDMADKEYINIKSGDTYYTVKNCIDIFLKSVTKKEKGMLLNMIDQYFIKQNNIDENNIDKFVNDMGKYQKIYIKEIYKELKNQKNDLYYIYGSLSVNGERNIDVVYVIKIDYEKLVFSIIPEYKNFKIENIREKFLKYDSDIINNMYNSLEIKKADDKYMAKQYFENFQYFIINDTENFYNKIDEKYKNKRFNNDVNQYKKYVKEKKDNINSSIITGFSSDNKGSYIEYICADNYNNHYTIKVYESLMDYKIVLDDYTLNTSEYSDLYSKLTNEQKVYTNIELFFKMINTKDYNSAYGVLDDNFKNRYFKTIEQFESYIKKNFFEYTLVKEKIDFQDKNKYFICTIKISSGVALSSFQDNITFFVALKDGTDFKLSFEINT